MFSEFPFSGLVLCYAPLALVIVGFIIAAFVTDGQARSRYLRRLDPRPDGERVDEPIVRAEPLKAVTPAGLVVTLPPYQAAVVAPVEPDDLQRIEGIGPKISQILQEAGITSFSQLASKTAVELRALLDAKGITAISDPTSWPQQAQLAAEGDWQALDELQAKLLGGKAG